MNETHLPDGRAIADVGYDPVRRETVMSSGVRVPDRVAYDLHAQVRKYVTERPTRLPNRAERRRRERDAARQRSRMQQAERAKADRLAAELARDTARMRRQGTPPMIFDEMIDDEVIRLRNVAHLYGATPDEVEKAFREVAEEYR